MSTLARVRSWVRACLHRSRLEREMDEELRFHLEQRTTDLVRSGMNESDAVRTARIDFGAIEARKDEMREALGLRLFDEFRSDLRYTFRQIRREPAFALVILATLALGIGANTAIFSYIDATSWRPLPVRGADRLVRVFTSEQNATGDHRRGPSSYLDYLDLRDHATAFEDIVTYDHRGGLLYGDGDATRLPVDVVSPNYFTALGLNAVAGRTFTESDGPRGSHDADDGVVISYALWQQRFGGDAGVVGRHVRLTNAQVTILGVAPRGFRGVDVEEPAAIWLPPAVWSRNDFLTRHNSTPPGSSGLAAEFTTRANRRRGILARLRPDSSLVQAQSQLDAIGSRLARSYPDSNRDSRFTAIPEADARSAHARLQAMLLLAVALAVGLIAAANVANLQLARAEARLRETAMRLALGGGRRRLIRQWMAESLVLAALGCAAAILLGGWIIHMLPTLFASSLTNVVGYEFRLDRRALSFTIAIAAAATIVFGLAPAWQATRLDVAVTLRGGGPRGGGAPRIRDVLVVMQVAMSLVLLVAAGLLVRTLQQLQLVDPGFNPHQNVLLLYVVPELALRDPSDLHNYYRAVQERLAALPGVEAATLAQRVPFSPSLGGAEKAVRVPGVQPPPGHDTFRINFDVVAPGYFSLMGTPLLRGRVFGPEDGPDAAKNVVVNDAMARRFWGPRDAVGQQIRIGRADYVVVGVVKDTKWQTLTEPARPLLYFPMTQEVSDSLTILLRTRSDPAALTAAARAELRRINSAVPLLSAITLNEHMEFTINDERIRARLTSAFAALGLVLAATGLYGVLAFIVARRTREIGIRVAVGARRRDIVRLVLAFGLRRVLAGTALGLGLALVFHRTVAGLLFGVRPADPATLATVVVVLTGAATVAALVPAHRATEVDPIAALRFD